ncbi:hypothetical protein M7I_7557 [Glarea lozoyensis 74030]|uniref:Uncharacterized protein n=1 Tax=Glarea lozoyensis (strain ATCC 74030 / MF5533) TaxID=1104152 RepID=H0EXL9_GLAL7|nr:hypothetical protein M7I_7557 [Glarea lozoyensis 74030]
MSARNLAALIDRRGGGKTNAAGGGWSIYTEEKKDGSDNPLNTQLPTPEPSLPDDMDQLNQNLPRGMKRRAHEDNNIVKRRKLLAQGRFGNTAKADDGKGIERFDIRLADAFPSFNFANTEDEYPLPDERPYHLIYPSTAFSLHPHNLFASSPS